MQEQASIDRKWEFMGIVKKCKNVPFSRTEEVFSAQIEQFLGFDSYLMATI